MPESPKTPTARNWSDRLRERLAAEGLTPSSHREAIDEIAEHLNDLDRGAMMQGHTREDADAIVEAELVRVGPAGGRRRRAGETAPMSSP